MFGLSTPRNGFFFVTLTAAALSLGMAHCGPKEGPKVAAVKAGDMPVGGDWTGVYFSKTYGYLHLVKEGDTISGKWRVTAGDKWGEMSGKVTGNLFKYEWKEHTIGMVGAAAGSSGRGYFVYKVPKEGEAHVIDGEWGLKTDETGQKWEAVKQQNMASDPDSVMPDELEGRSSGGGWDEGEGAPKGGGGGATEGGGDTEGGDEGGSDDEGGGLDAPLE